MLINPLLLSWRGRLHWIFSTCSFLKYWRTLKRAFRFLSRNEFAEILTKRNPRKLSTIDYTHTKRKRQEKQEEIQSYQYNFK